MLVNIILHIQAKYRKVRMKTEVAYSIWKKIRPDWQTDNRASDKLRWLRQQGC